MDFFLFDVHYPIGQCAEEPRKSEHVIPVQMCDEDPIDSTGFALTPLELNLETKDFFTLSA